MNANERKEAILAYVRKSEVPVSASVLAKKFNVSRQSIVGDVALLRAMGEQIIATPRGYVMESTTSGVIATIAVVHDHDHVEEELNLIVDQGVTVLDVIVEHAVYGQLSGKLHIASRYDVAQFMKRINEHEAKPLSTLTGGLHLHTIQAKDQASIQRVLNVLREHNFLYEK